MLDKEADSAINVRKLQIQKEMVGRSNDMAGPHITRGMNPSSIPSVVTRFNV